MNGWVVKMKGERRGILSLLSGFCFWLGYDMFCVKKPHISEFSI